MRKRIDKLDFTKIKNFYSVKTPLRELNNRPEIGTGVGKDFAKDKFDLKKTKKLSCKICKGILKFNLKNNPMKNGPTP